MLEVKIKEFIKNIIYTNQSAEIAKKYSLRFLIIFLTIISLFQVLRPRSYKEYLDKPIEMIQQLCPENNAVLINDVGENRLIYHSKTENIQYEDEYIKEDFAKIKELSKQGKEVFLYIKNPTELFNENSSQLNLLRKINYKDDNFKLYKYGEIDYSKIEPISNTKQVMIFYFLALVFVIAILFLLYKLLNQCEFRNKILNSNDWTITFALFAFAFLLCLPSIILIDVPDRDSSRFYIQMIRAISAKNWEHAYFPMIPPLFSTIGGFLANLFKLEAFTAAKIVSSLFFALTVFPLYSIKKKVFSKEIAIMATVLFVICSRFISYGIAGGIDTTKMFFVVLFIFAFFKFIKKANIKIIIILAISLAGISLARAEGIGIAIFFLIFPCLFEISRKKFPIKTLIVAVLMFLLMFPWLKYEYQTIGFPVTDARQIGYVQKIENLLGVKLISDKSILPEQPKELIEYKNKLEQNITLSNEKISFSTKLKTLWRRLIVEFWKGLYPFYFILAIPIFYSRIKNKKFSKGEKVLFAGFAIHSFIVIASVGGTWTQKRYIIQAMPLLLGWCSIAVIAIYSFLQKKKISNTPIFIFSAIFIILSINSGIKDVSPFQKNRDKIKGYNRKKIAAIVNNIYCGEKTPPLKTTKREYANGLFPKIYSSAARIPCMLSAEHIKVAFTKKISLRQLKEYCDIKMINIILYDEYMKQIYPELDKINKDLKDKNFTFIYQVGETKIFTYKN